MKYSVIEPLASCVAARLRPFCERIEIAGSIRRERADCGDIEVVCIPKHMQTGLFGDEVERDPGFIKAVQQMHIVRGAPSGKYCRTSLMSNFDTGNAYRDVFVDIFITEARLWGSVLAIRTGSADFSHYFLAKRWTKLGYRSKDCVLYDEDMNGHTFKEEAELFDFLGLKFIEPKDRDAVGEESKKEYYESERKNVYF